MFRPSALGSSEWYQPRGLFVRLFVMNFAAALTVQIDSIALGIDHSTGINNLSWLLGYLFTIGGSYCGLTSWLWIRGATYSRRAAQICVLTAIVVVLFFPLLAAEPELLRAQLPSKRVQILYWSIMSLFYVLSAREVAKVVRGFLSQEESEIGRMRLGLTSASLQAASVFAVARVSAGLALTLDGLQPLMRASLGVADVSISVCLVCFLLAASPLRWLQFVGRFRIYVAQLRTEWELERLRRRLTDFTAPVPWRSPSWHDRLLRPSYVLYCTLIDILDRWSLLQEDLQASPNKNSAAMELNRQLGDMPATEDWVELLRYVREIAL